MSEQSNVQPAPRSRRRFFLIAACLIVLPAIALLLALHSSVATGYALRTIANRVDGLTIADVEGTLGGGLTLGNLHFANPSIDVQIRRLYLSAALGALMRGELVIRDVNINGIHVTPNATAPARPPAPIVVPELKAPLALSIEQLVIADGLWTPLPEMPLQSMTATLQWRGTTITVSKAKATTPTLTLAMEASIDTRDQIPVSTQLAWSFSEPMLRGQLQASGTLANLELVHTLEGDYALESRGSVQLLNRVEPFIDMTHHCPSPCVINDIALEQNQLSHRGTLTDSIIEVTAQVSAGPLSSQQVRGDFYYMDDRLTIRSLNTQGSQLEAVLSGWLKDPRTSGDGSLFSIKGKAARVDAALIHPSAEGSLTARFSTSGDSPESLRAELGDINGTINGYALSGQGIVERNGQQLIVPQSSLKLGDNTLSVRGRGSRSALSFDADIDLPALEQIDPRASGSIAASATIQGSPDKPRGRASGSVSALKFDELALASAQFELLLDAAGQVDGSLSARELSQGNRDLGAIDVRLGGSLEALGIAATLDHPQLDANVASTLSVAGDTRTLRIEKATLDAGQVGQWSLQAPFEINQSAGSLEVAPHLWQSGEAFAQVHRLEQHQGTLDLKAELAQLPLALAAGLLPPEVSIAGTVDAQVDLGRNAGLWRGNVDWQQKGTVLKLRAGDGSRRLALPVVSLQIQQAADGASAQLTMEGDFGFNVAANVEAANSAALGESPISGTLEANLQDVSWLTPWLGGASDLAGTLQTKLAIGGQMNAPVATGSATFTDGTLAYTDAGLQLEQVTLEARTLEAGPMALSGSANSGGGALRFKGQIKQPWTSARELELAVTGTDVQAFNAADYQLWLSPDLTVTASAQGARVSGEVGVPRAQIRVRELPPDVVKRSDDIVVAGREARERLSLPFDGDLKVTLGDDVHVFALGLDADVGGELRVRLDADKAPRLVGRIFLDEGRYAAYGQKLDIERGNLIYAGPIDNPTLDIRAARKIDDAGSSITAGVMVSGPATAPEISIFTDPATSDTDALSYLLLGRAAADTSGVEGEALSQAALAIGMSQSSPLTTRLASGLGLDELTVGGDSVDAAELVAGKQINDRLYIRYRYGVFSNLGAILLRYRLSRRLALEAGSSDVQSLDVLYTIEK